MSQKRMTMLVLILLLCLGVQMIQAQETGDAAAQFAVRLDQAASMHGLSTGDGQVSAVEQSVASTMIDDVTGYSQLVTEFSQSSPENASTVQSMDAGYLNVQNELPITDPNEPALRQAIADYKKSVAEAEIQAARQAILDLSEELIEEMIAEHENSVKKHVKKVVEDEFDQIPEERLDSISGIYTFGPNNVTYSDGCTDDDLNGENGGTDASEFNPDDPRFQVQVCYSYSYGLVSVGSEMFRWYGDGTPNTYQSDIHIDSFDNSENQKIVTVIDEANFTITQISTSGTCTRTSTTTYKLYAPGTSMGCNPNAKVWVVNGEPVDVETGNPPAEDEEVIIDPIVAGEYAVAWMPFDPQTCDQDYAPTFNTVTLNPVSFDEVDLTVNGQTYSFGGSGMNEGMNGSFDMYEDTVFGALNRRFATDFYFSWTASSDDHQQSCSAEGLLTLGTAAADQPVFNPPVVGGEDEDDSDVIVAPDLTLDPTAFVAPESGTYSTESLLLQGMGCPAEAEAALPEITQVTLDITSDSAVFTANDEQYTLAGDGFGYTFYEFKDDNSGLAVSLSGVQDGVVYGSYTVYTPEGQMCMLNLTLTP